MSKLSDELKKVQAEIESTRDARATAIAERDTHRGAIEAGEGEIDRNSDTFKSARAAAKTAGELGDKLTDLQAAEAEYLTMLGRGDEAQAKRDQRNGNGPENRGADIALTPSIRQAAERIVEDNQATFAEYGDSSAQTGKRRLGLLATREQAAQIIHSPYAATLLTGDVQPLIPEDRRAPRAAAQIRTRFLDLIPIGQTDSNAIETVVEIPTAVGAGMVLEDSRKPQENFELKEESFPVRNVAAWIKLHKNALEDAPRVKGLLERRLPQKLRKRLEMQALAGSGNAPELRGLLLTTGIGVFEQVALQPDVEAILDAITIVILSDYDPNVVALSPRRSATIRKMREEANAGQYLFGSPAALGDTTVWGVQTVAAASIADDRSIVGDTDGMELTVRSGIETLISDSDGEDFTHNRVTILCEGRFALPVEEPGAFCRVDFGA